MSIQIETFVNELIQAQIAVNQLSGEGTKPAAVGAYLAISKRGDVAEWVRYLDDNQVKLSDLMKIVKLWEESIEDSIAYYMEILSELRSGLVVLSEAISY